MGHNDIDRRTLKWFTQAQHSNGCEVGPYIVANQSGGGNPTHYVAEVFGAPYLGSVDTWPIARMLREAPAMLAELERCRDRFAAYAEYLRECHWEHMAEEFDGYVRDVEAVIARAQ